MAYVTVADMRNQEIDAGLADDAAVTTAIADASLRAERAANTWWEPRDKSLYVKGSGRDVLLLDHPLISLTSVLIDGVAVSDVQTRPDSVTGLTNTLVRTSGIFSRGSTITVAGSFGNVDLSGSSPATPADGYIVLCTGTGGAFVEGYTYTYTAGTTNAYGAGVLFADGELATVIGTDPDIVVGGTAADEYIFLSDKLSEDRLTYVDVTVGAGVGAAGVVIGDNADWIGATILGTAAISGVDQVIESLVISGTGGLTLTTAVNSTAEAVYRVSVLLAG